jgi:hypothetical protein
LWLLVLLLLLLLLVVVLLVLLLLVPNAAPLAPPAAWIYRRDHRRDHHMRATCALSHTQHSRSLAPHQSESAVVFCSAPWSRWPVPNAAQLAPPPPGSTAECTR